MSNRSNTASVARLDARRALTSQIRDFVRVIPAFSCDWKSIDWSAIYGGGGADPGLERLSALTIDAPARVGELRALWNESVATSAFAWRLAPELGADADTSAIAGLLHRLGDVLTLRAIGRLEHESGMRLDAAGKADLCADYSIEALDRAVRAWEVPARAATMAAAWRRLRDFPEAAADAAVVHLARFMAIERVSPRFCTPGIVEAAAAEMNLSAEQIGRLRDGVKIDRLLLS